MNKNYIINSVINNDIKFAKVVNIPTFKSAEDVAKFIEKLQPGDKINNTIFDPETGEVYLSKGQKVTKYHIYALPKELRKQPVSPPKVREKEDPREDFLSFDERKKYYTFQHKGDGTYIIFRSDKKPFNEFDEMNISGFIDDINDSDPNSQMYKYDSTIKDFEEGKRYYTIRPVGIDKNYILENFDEFFNVKYIKLKKYFSDYAEHKEVYDTYDPDADIPVEIIKKDKLPIAKEDIETINSWLKTRDFGRAEVELAGGKGERKLDNTNLLISFPL